VGTGTVIYDPANRLAAPVLPANAGTAAPSASQQVAP
jgi:hypothetical protein